MYVTFTLLSRKLQHYCYVTVTQCLLGCAIPLESLDHMLGVFNNIHPRLQFTFEVGQDNKLDFLDVSLILIDNRLIFDWYHKPIPSQVVT